MGMSESGFAGCWDLRDTVACDTQKIREMTNEREILIE